MSTLRFMLFMSLCLSLSCGSQPNSGGSNNPTNQNANSPLLTNSNLSPTNSLLTNSNANSNTNPAVDMDMYRKLEAQQLEDKRKAEEKLKNGGNKTNSNTNSNVPVKTTVPKGNQTTY